MAEPDPLAFKAYEIEELADVYFFRPLGMAVARAARALGVRPTPVTVVAGVFGVAGGALLSVDRFGALAFILLIVHSILDSSDGQLARMTGQTSEFGRLLDGLSGYVTHIAIYVAILGAALAAGGGAAAVALVVAAAASNIVHAQMYDYHRSAYMACAISGRVPVGASPPSAPGQVGVRPLLAWYQSVQRSICGLHEEVESSMARRASGGAVRDEDRRRYRQFFYWPVRGWNLLGDNTRFYAIGVLVWFHRVAWFPLVVLVPMNLAFVALWLWQARRDRAFLEGESGPSVRVP